MIHLKFISHLPLSMNRRRWNSPRYLTLFKLINVLDARSSSEVAYSFLGLLLVEDSAPTIFRC